jgi:flagellar basal-body rod modification protein FlgD
MTTSITDTTKSYSMGQDEFLTLLCTQLQNQNPLDPMDGTEFAVQLAQFTSVEQLTNLNTGLASVRSDLVSMMNLEVIGGVGREMTYAGDQLEVTGDTAEIRFVLDDAIQQGTVTIYDEDGIKVGTADLGALEAGMQSISWDSSGVDAGTYTFEVSALDGDGNSVSVQTMMTGTATAVSWKNGVPYYRINGTDVPFSSVVSFGGIDNG